MMFFVGLEDEDFVSHTLKALGSICVRHYEFMLRPELKEFYHQLLTSDLAPIEMKADVLRNIEMYLQEEEQRMIRQDKECKCNLTVKLIFTVTFQILKIKNGKSDMEILFYS